MVPFGILPTLAILPRNSQARTLPIIVPHVVKLKKENWTTMAITLSPANAATVLPAGAPAIGAGGQPIVGPGDFQEPILFGYVTATGDGAATAVTVNWIDGTQTLPFTPTAVEVTRVGGTDTSVGLPFPKTITNVSFSLNFSVAPANTTTQLVAIKIYK
jgi:hypothetical protein